MKIKITKIICLLLVLSMLFTITSFGAYTTDMTSEVYTFEYEDRTIEIDAEGVTYEQAQIIADKMIYGEDGASTYGILCIFGHKLDMTVAAETTHKYYSDNPRCLRRTYEVEYCTRSSCTYSDATLTSSVRMYCCAED